MKVNKIPIFKISSHLKVVVEKQLAKELEIPDKSVPVYHNFNYQALIGMAHLTKNKRGVIVADIHLLSDIKGYPAVAYRTNDTAIYALSIGTKPNIDKTIKSL